GTSVTVTDSPAVMLGIGDGLFVDIWPELGISWTAAARGMSLADLDGDGDDDFVIVTTTGEVRAFRNDLTAASLTVTAAQGCDPTGAVVTVRTGSSTYQRLLAPHTFASSHEAAVVVGTGGGNATVTVDWAVGTTDVTSMTLSAHREAIEVAGCGV
ncbi:MAG: hypothetical protein ACE5GB_06945, partial [Acidimicrobiales bacterium]